MAGVDKGDQLSELTLRSRVALIMRRWWRCGARPRVVSDVGDGLLRLSAGHDTGDWIALPHGLACKYQCQETLTSRVYTMLPAHYARRIEERLQEPC